MRAARTIFSGLGFTVSSGEYLSLEGPNGSGKSSLLRILAGLLSPSAGTLRCNGDLFEAAAGPMQRQIGYLGHADGMKASLSAWENICFWARHDGQGETAAHAALEALRLSSLKDFPCHVLSAGQRRRLSLCRLLVQHRPIWLLDEPTVSLDQDSAGDFATILALHLEAGGLCVAATHAELGVTPARRLMLGGSP